MTHDEIIRIRQAEIFNDVQEIRREIIQLMARVEILNALEKQRVAEHDMLQHVTERGLISGPANKKLDRIGLEDSVKRIFDQAGKPLRIGELLDELEKFGYIWSSYQTGYYRLRQTRLISETGARGYYNIIR